MNRRKALILMAVLSGQTMLGLRRMKAAGADSATTSAKGILSAADCVLLNEIGETILPATSGSGGAEAANVAEFIEDTVRNLYSEEEQATFTAGLVRLQALCRNQFSGQEFLGLTATERGDFLLGLERTKPQPAYYRMIKQLTLRGYFTSEIGATQAMAHVAVPGRFDGVVGITPGTKAWSN